MAEKVPLIASRGSYGVHFIYGPPREGMFDKFPCEESKSCKDMAFSKDGSLFAWCNGQNVNIISTKTFKCIGQIDKSKTAIQFSPKGSFLSVWEQYSAKGSAQESCNLEIWDIKTMTCVKDFIQKRQSDCHPKWSDDEIICGRNVNNEVHFYENADFSRIGKKIFIQKVSIFSIAPGEPSYHIACFIPGIKGQPSFIRLFMFPKFEGANAVLAQKSFFRAEKAEFYWHKAGKDLIVLATSDVDKNGASYYGEQNLFYLNVKGDTARIPLGKDGPVYSIKWNPNGFEFCVVYGFMPAKATIYNLKCEPVFDFGTGPRNDIEYTLSGTKLLFSGFGNLQGNVEVWDLKNKKLIKQFIASDSTYISWSPDGEYILTATTSPRLRIGNGYRIWHYTGSLLQEKFINPQEETWDMKWQPIPTHEIKEKPIVYTSPVEGIQSCKPQASKEVYRPPGAKGQPSSFRLHVNESPKDLTQKDVPQQQQTVSKNKKKNQARKAKKEHEKEHVENSTISNNSTTALPIVHQNPPPTSMQLTGNPETDKRIRALYKKLDQIEKLKSDQKQGRQLELNQIEKLNKEVEIIEELRRLVL